MPSLSADSRPAHIQALYEAFGDRTIPKELSYCTYCDDAEYERSLHHPLATLPRALVGKYLADAIHHTGSAEDFLYFVPRIVELEAEESFTFFFVLPDRLKSAGFDGWPAPMRGPVLRARSYVLDAPQRVGRYHVRRVDSRLEFAEVWE